MTNQSFADTTGVAPALSSLDADVFQISTDRPAILAPTTSCTVTPTVLASDNTAFVTPLDAGGSAPTSTGVTVAASGVAPAFVSTGDDTFLLDGSIVTPALAQRTFTLANAGTLAGVPVAPSVSGTGASDTFSLFSITCGHPLCHQPTSARLPFAPPTPTTLSLSQERSPAKPLPGPWPNLPVAVAAAWTFDNSPSEIFAIAALASTSTQTFTPRNIGTLTGRVATRAITGITATNYEIIRATFASKALPSTTLALSAFTALATVANQTDYPVGGQRHPCPQRIRPRIRSANLAFDRRAIMPQGRETNITTERKAILIGATVFYISPTFRQFPPSGPGFSIGANTDALLPERPGDLLPERRSRKLLLQSHLIRRLPLPVKEKT